MLSEGEGIDALRVIRTLTEYMSSDAIRAAAGDLRQQASLASDPTEREALGELADRLFEIAVAQRAR